MNRIRSYTRGLYPADRRKDERFESNRCVKFSRLARALSIEIKHMSRIMDVSQTGLRLLSSESIQPKTVLKFEFVGTHELRPFTIKGVVVWTKAAESHTGHYELGVIFLHAPANAASIIQGRLTETQT